MGHAADVADRQGLAKALVRGAVIVLELGDSGEARAAFGVAAGQLDGFIEPLKPQGEAAEELEHLRRRRRLGGDALFELLLCYHVRSGQLEVDRARVEVRQQRRGARERLGAAPLPLLRPTLVALLPRAPLLLRVALVVVLGGGDVLLLPVVGLALLVDRPQRSLRRQRFRVADAELALLAKEDIAARPAAVWAPELNQRGGRLCRREDRLAELRLLAKPVSARPMHPAAV